MAFKKSENEQYKIHRFEDFLEAQKVFEDSNANEEDRLAALDYLIEYKEISYILDILSKLFCDNDIKGHVYIDYAFANFGKKPKRESDFDKLFVMLKSDNAYLRNEAILFLREYGKEASEFFRGLMDSEDRDVRIFSINILGDVKFDDSINMLRYFIAKEKDLNALMTAVDYIGEIGDESDIALLEALRQDYKNEPYVTFGVDLAIRRLRG